MAPPVKNRRVLVFPQIALMPHRACVDLEPINKDLLATLLAFDVAVRISPALRAMLRVLVELALANLDNRVMLRVRAELARANPANLVTPRAFAEESRNPTTPRVLVVETADQRLRKLRPNRDAVAQAIRQPKSRKMAQTLIVNW